MQIESEESDEVAALCAAKLSCTGDKVLFVSFWSEASVLLLSLPGLAPLHRVAVSENDCLLVSLHFVGYGGLDYLVCGTSTGKVVSLYVHAKRAGLQVKERVVAIGTVPVQLRGIEFRG